jgi:hypothetical protein
LLLLAVHHFLVRVQFRAPSLSSATRYNAPLQLLGDMMDKCGHAFRLQVAKKILPRLQVHPSPNHQTSRVGLHPYAHFRLQILARDSTPLIKEHVHYLIRAWGATHGPTAGAIVQSQYRVTPTRRFRSVS